MQIFWVLITQILYRPIFNILIIFLAVFGWNLGIAIILLTLLIRGIMFKSTMAGNDMQAWMSNLQPKIDELQKKHADDPQKLSEETLKLFKTEGKAPLKGCLTMIIQIPIFLCLYWVVRKFAGDEWIPTDRLYSFFYSFWSQYADVSNVNSTFLGIDLLTAKNIPLTLIVAVLNFSQMKLSMIAQPKKASATPGMPDMSNMMWMMSVMMAVMMGALVYKLNSAIGLYLVTTSLFSICQMGRKYRAILSAKFHSIFQKGKPTLIQPK